MAGNGELWGGHRASQTLEWERERKKITFSESLLSTVYFVRFFKCSIRGKCLHYICLKRHSAHAMAFHSQHLSLYTRSQLPSLPETLLQPSSCLSSLSHLLPGSQPWLPNCSPTHLQNADRQATLPVVSH